jgi:pimeloyl-ACP methyl ester carboxylesterase
MGDLIEASATDLQRIDFPAAGHLISLEAPQECADRIVSFLG